MKRLVVLLFVACAPVHIPTPLPVFAKIIWEPNRCLRAPGHENVCADGYVISKCDFEKCICEIHSVWTGIVLETSALHELFHCIQNAAGVGDPFHEGEGWGAIITTARN